MTRCGGFVNEYQWGDLKEWWDEEERPGWTDTDPRHARRARRGDRSARLGLVWTVTGQQGEGGSFRKLATPGGP
ncbi:hypothetical protein Are01nite_10990 [Actinoplanes regularis]|nr:hypothetical protein Are01nite_10990 [Actinoplanes regularis]